jgi:uncharacterized protein YkwD
MPRLLIAGVSYRTMTWNYVDALLLLLIALSVANGWWRGLMRSLLDLAQWLGSLLLGLRFYKPVANFLDLFLDLSSVWLLPLAFLLTAVTSGALIQLLGYQLVKRIPERTHESRVNRWLGVLPGLASGVITAAIAASLLLTVPISDGLHRAARESVLTNRFAESSSELEASLSPIFDEAIGRTIGLLTIRPEPESTERVDLPYTVVDPRPRSDLEADMLALVNKERAAAGLGALEADPELADVARRHSADMFARGYFSHATPEGKSPFDRIREARVSFLTAGENLALAPTMQLAHTGLMNSPGHRANILRPQFGRLGIGILDGGRRGLMVTQNFRN